LHDRLFCQDSPSCRNSQSMSRPQPRHSSDSRKQRIAYPQPIHSNRPCAVGRDNTTEVKRERKANNSNEGEYRPTNNDTPNMVKCPTIEKVSKGIHELLSFYRRLYGRSTGNESCWLTAQTRELLDNNTGFCDVPNTAARMFHAASAFWATLLAKHTSYVSPGPFLRK
jgi:hypothetical protein